MPAKGRLDSFGTFALIFLAFLFATNQVAIKIGGGGFAPAFAVGLRSVIAGLCVLVWMRLRGHVPFWPDRRSAGRVIALGLVFSSEFLCLFMALDLTTVTRSTIMLYTMPMWFALAAHVLLPDERLTPPRIAGLVLAFGGMVLALLDGDSRPDEGSILGDLLALGAAISWAALTFLSRQAGRAGIGADSQLLWMLVVSAPVFFAAAALSGEALRSPDALTLAALIYQSVVVVAGGFLFWFWLLGRYPPGAVAAFSFLSPLFAISLGWLVLDDPVSPRALMGGAMVAGGLVLVSWPRRGLR